MSHAYTYVQVAAAMQLCLIGASSVSALNNHAIIGVQDGPLVRIHVIVS